jgi:hypothetical protein
MPLNLVVLSNFGKDKMNRTYIAKNFLYPLLTIMSNYHFNNIERLSIRILKDVILSKILHIRILEVLLALPKLKKIIAYKLNQPVHRQRDN